MSPHPRRPTDELITGRETARRLNVHENTIRNWADRGVLRVAEQLPGRGYRRYDPADVEELKQAMAAAGSPGTPDSLTGAHVPASCPECGQPLPRQRRYDGEGVPE